MTRDACSPNQTQRTQVNVTKCMTRDAYSTNQTKSKVHGTKHKTLDSCSQIKRKCSKAKQWNPAKVPRFTVINDHNKSIILFS